ncbi:MAG: hypothetical protein NZ740_07445 [Kiritimatiellae bacterium]|nr:hypothetical protein [Kiritimatiellia bacterium]MDW8458933.1 hypothetical protein [Verrucomicrobiota bacterium]
MRVLAGMALAGILAILTAGCATTDPYAESSIPWNAPQSWESAPMIPGLEGR